MKKSILTILGIVASLLIIGVIIYFTILNKEGQYTPQKISEISCIYPISVQGDSMEPTLKDGSIVSMNKCIEDIENIDTDTIVVFSDGDVNRIGRVTEKISLQEGIYYKILRDNREGEFTILSTEIIAIYTN